MTKFLSMTHRWEWIVPLELEDTEPFVQIYNDTVDPYGMNRERRVSTTEFVPDEEEGYDHSEFTMWAEQVWHVAVWEASKNYIESKNRWLALLEVFGNLLVDGPDIDYYNDDPNLAYVLNPDGSVVKEEGQ